MTNDEFLGYMDPGLDIIGHRVTGRIVLPPIPLPLQVQVARPSALQPVFAIRIDHGEELAMWFDGGESLVERLTLLDSVIQRWHQLRPAWPRAMAASQLPSRRHRSTAASAEFKD